MGFLRAGHNPDGAARPGGASGFARAAAVALLEIDAGLIAKPIRTGLDGNCLEWTTPDADGALLAFSQETEFKIDLGGADDPGALLREGQPLDCAAGADLIASVTILAAVILVKAQAGRQQGREPVSA